MSELRPKRAADAVWREIAGDVYIALGDGTTHVLEGSAVDIWKMCNGQNTVTQIAGIIAVRYAEAQERVEADVSRFAAEGCAASILGFARSSPGLPVLSGGGRMPPASVGGALQHGWSRGLPIKVDIETTYRCPLRCLHCYNARSVHGAGAEAEELSVRHFSALFDGLLQAGTFFITLTGGEPLAHPYFSDILAMATQRSFSISIITNGLLLTKERALELSQCRVRRVQVSLQGGTAEVHDQFVGRLGAFKSTLNGIENLLAAGLMVDISFVATTFNFSSISSLLRLAADRSTSVSISPFILPEVKGDVSPLRWRLGGRQLRELIERGWYTLNDLVCTAGRKCCVRASGTVTPCLVLDWPLGNIKDEGIVSIWNGPLREALETDERFRPAGKCLTCVYRQHCHRCPGVAAREVGDLRAALPFACEVALIRATAEGN